MDSSPSGRAPRAAFLVSGLAVGVLLTIAAGLLAGVRWGDPRDDSAEAGFARDMATHHAQAVDMAFMLRDASADSELRSLAYDIIVTQTAQRGMFMGWLQEWRVPQASTRPRMAWMPGHGPPTSQSAAMPPEPMHGMASDEQLARLRAATGRDAEVLFLQLMIRHHEGGVVMARAVLALTSRPEVVSIAKAIDTGQSAEIALMTRLLVARGAEPLPSLLM